MTAPDETWPPEAVAQLYVFQKCVPAQVRLHEVLRSLGNVDGLTCLDIGADDGVVSYHLRKRGGTWATVTSGEGACQSVKAVVGDNVETLRDASLPYKKKSFDVVVVMDYLERVPSDLAFIEECHRVLKDDGRLIVNVTRLKPVSVVGGVRRMLGTSPQKQGLYRVGYTESELFNILKDGFDVHQMRNYSKFFVELTDAVVRSIVRRAGAGVGPVTPQVKRVYFVAGLFYRLAYQLDLLLFFTRGYNLIATAKRRPWRPRKTPVLVDGRSITEAVLSKALD